MLNKIFIACIVIFSYSNLHSQEHRLNAKKVPENIKTYITANYPAASKIKYYHQIENDTLFIEVDFDAGIDKYSLLFDLNGGLYETEIFITFKELPSDIATKITNDLAARFTKYKILHCYEVNPATNALYEINVRGTNKASNGVFELFFDKSGRFIKIKEEIIKPINTAF